MKSNFNKAVADYEGIAVHCAAGSAVCATANGGEPDVLPQEPGGYTGFNALYGHKFVAPVISPSSALNDLDGNLITDDSTPPNPGFPGFGEIDGRRPFPTWQRCRSTAFRSLTRISQTSMTMPLGKIHMRPPCALPIPSRVGLDLAMCATTRKPRLTTGVRQILRAPRGGRHQQEQHVVRHHSG